MTISGRIRSVLTQVTLPEGGEHRVPALMVRRVRGEEFHLADWICDFAPDLPQERHGIYYTFGLAGVLRLLSAAEMDRKIGTIVRQALDRFEAYAREGQQLSLVNSLWTHWVLLLGAARFGRHVEAEILAKLWSHGFAMQGAAGHLHPLDAETVLDRFVYDELVAIHAAYNSAKFLGGKEIMEQVHRAVRWHVENTQPDNTTNEPWALAAFSALDETGTFADQQLHDAVAWSQNGPPLPAGRVPLAMGLLADAVLTLENG